MPLESTARPHGLCWHPIHLHTLPPGMCHMPTQGMVLSIEWRAWPLREIYGASEWPDAPGERLTHFMKEWPSLRPAHWPHCPVTFSVEGEEDLGDISSLHHLHDAGLQVIQAFHNRITNQYISRFQGLSKKGLALFKKMDQLGMALDLSHLDGKLLHHVLEHAPQRRIVSHVLCSDMLDKSITSRSNAMSQDDLTRCDAELYGIPFIDDLLCKKGTQHKEERKTDISLLARHIIRMREIVGIERIALGPDYYGETLMRSEGVKVVQEMDDVSGLLQLSRELGHRGWPKADIDALYFGNAQRVFQEAAR